MHAGSRDPLESPETGPTVRNQPRGGRAAGVPSGRTPSSSRAGNNVTLRESLGVQMSISFEFRFHPFCALAALAGAVPTFAQDAVPDDRRVVVTATRMPSRIEEVLASAIVIDRQEIDRSLAGDAADLLRFHAGLDIARNGGPGQTTSLFIRGAESNHTLVMVDGVRINPGTLGVPALQNLQPALIERIEVIKGPRSSLYGTDAIGGVVNIITRRGSRDGWSAELGYGDYETREASLSGGVSGRAGSLDLGVSWIDSEGFPTRTGDATDRGFDNLSLNLGGSTTLGAAELEARAWHAEGNTEYSDFFLTPVDQDFVNSALSVTGAFATGPTGRLALTAAYMEDDAQQNQSPDFLETRRLTLEAQQDWRVGDRHTLSAGAQYSDEDAESESFGLAFDETTELWNLFVQDQLAYGAHRGVLALGYTDHETAGSEVTWNAEYAYAFTGDTELVLSGGTGFRAPDATDRFGFGGNPALEPERSQSLGAELRHRIGERHAFRLGAYENEIEDLIEFVVLSFDPFVGENRNVDEARIRGIEAGYAFGGERWSLDAELALADPENRGTGQQLLRRPKESATLAVQRRFERFDLGVNLLAAGEREDVGFPAPVTLDSYVVVDLTAGWKITDRLSLRARVENLLDEDYELADGFNTPERGVYVALRYAPEIASAVTRR
jgi:vitamin B12 transporter